MCGPKLSTVVPVTACVLAVLGCSGDGGRGRSPGGAPSVVLSATEFAGGPIAGAVACEQADGRAVLDAPCLPEPTVLAGAVLACGPTEASIEVEPHVWYVRFPSRGASGGAGDLAVVDCVRRRVGFAFRAGVATRDGEEPDERPFAVLRARR